MALACTEGTDLGTKSHPCDFKTYRHDTVHNMYGYLMTRSAGEGLLKISPNQRKLIYSRASTIGAHRYGGIWTGDVNSWWSHLEQHIKVLPGLNMCGFLYTGSDIGGFGCDTTRDLVLRWTALGIFTPLTIRPYPIPLQRIHKGSRKRHHVFQTPEL